MVLTFIYNIGSYGINQIMLPLTKQKRYTNFNVVAEYVVVNEKDFNDVLHDEQERRLNRTHNILPKQRHKRPNALNRCTWKNFQNENEVL